MHDGWSEHWCHHARVMTRSHTASSSSTAYPVARALVLPLLEHARHLAAACMSMATPACRSAVLMRGWQAAVHINLGYVYAEGGGQGLYPGAMHKAAGMRVSLAQLNQLHLDRYLENQPGPRIKTSIALAGFPTMFLPL